MDSPALVLSEVVRILDELGVVYVLVGSMASSTHGMYRATSDLDFLADIKSHQVPSLVEALEDNFYVDKKSVQQALARGQSFNAIHFDLAFKVDIFVPKDEFSRNQLERRELKNVSSNLEQKVYVATAEDTILAKLRWYRSGGEVSIPQWNDVLGVLGASETTLDTNYLREWATKLGVHDLLEKAMSETS